MTTSKTIQQIIDEWLDGLDVAAISKKSYRAKVYLWFRWLAGHGYDPRMPSHAAVIEYKRDLEADKSTLTIDGYMTAVRLFYKYCERAGYCANIATGIRTASRSKLYRKMPLTAEQAATLLGSIDTRRRQGRRDKLIIAMMITLGLRTCEIERIDICDIDRMFDKTVVRVQRKGRTDKAEAIALTPYLCDLLADYMDDRDVQSTAEPLFISTRSRQPMRLLRTSISEIVHDRLRAIGIDDKKITAHSLRHTCACLMIQGGADLETVRDMLGHTSTNTTRIYASWMQSMMLIRNTPSRLVEGALNLTGRHERSRMTI